MNEAMHSSTNASIVYFLLTEFPRLIVGSLMLFYCLFALFQIPWFIYLVEEWSKNSCENS